MGNPLGGYQFLSVAASTWMVGFAVALFLFAASYIYTKWRRCSTLARRYILRRSEYDYKEIFKHYLHHINSIQDKRSLYRAILQVVCEIVGSDDASLLLKDNGEYTVKESLGSKPSSFKVDGINDFLKWLKDYHRTISRTQLVNSRDFIKVKGDGLQYCVQFHAEACVPIFTGGLLLGVINIGSKKSGDIYDRPTRELLNILGGQFAIAIYNATLYEDIVRRNVKLQEVGRLKSQLLSNVSHELRTPLSSIIGLADLMAEGGDGPISSEQKDHLNMIGTSGRRLLETVTSMVDLAKLEANHLSLNVRRLNITKILNKIADGVSPNNDTKLRLTLTENTPSIYGDEEWLGKLFTHLLANAVKYTDNGEIVIDAEKAGEMLKISVRDTGIGIASDKHGRIFEGFSQAHDVITKPFDGPGIGLAISKKVVELHGGRIWLTSTPGKGSNFFFTLPLKPTTVKSVELA